MPWYDFQNNNGSVVGSVTSIGQSTTGYNTSSDYRLKENAEAISDGITRLKTLKPYRLTLLLMQKQQSMDFGTRSNRSTKKQ